jgi:hypothetical protein
MCIYEAATLAKPLIELMFDGLEYDLGEKKTIVLGVGNGFARIICILLCERFQAMFGITLVSRYLANWKFLCSLVGL